VKFMQETYSLTVSKALGVVTTEDKKREKFFKKFHQAEHDNPIHYHMVLNMSRVNMKEATEFICSLISK